METRTFHQTAEELFKCLISMRNTAEGILASNVINVWNVYGGLNRAKNAVLCILTNGLRHENNPVLVASLKGKYPCEVYAVQESFFEEQLLFWIEHHLLEHSLSYCLRSEFLENMPIAEENPVLQLYQAYAFVRNHQLMSAVICCLEALEQSSVGKLSEISPLLINKTTFLSQVVPWVTDKMANELKTDFQDHADEFSLASERLRVRLLSNDSEKNACIICDSEFNHASASGTCFRCAYPDGNNLGPSQILAARRRSSVQDVVMRSALAAVLESQEEDEKLWYQDDGTGYLGDHASSLWSRLAHIKEISRSESSLFHEHSTDGVYAINEINLSESIASPVDKFGKTIEALDIPQLASKPQAFLNKRLSDRSMTSVTVFKRGHHRSKSDQMGVLRLDASGNEEDESKYSAAKNPSLSSSTKPTKHELHEYYHSADGCLFPKPYEGQSLISYLDSRSYDTGAQLDKENAHFSICEALITAIEQMQCRTADSGDDSDVASSDEEIKSWKKKISDRKSLRRAEKLKKESAFSDPSDTGKSSASVKTSSTLSSSHGSSPAENEQKREGISISASWENVSLASSSKTISPEVARKKEDAIVIIEAPDRTEVKPSDYSAEVVAKSLLKKFAGRSLPAASELKWMVTEDQVPQQLLPLPNAWPVAPNDLVEEVSFEASSSLKMFTAPSLLRGNLEWAPPRPQIVFMPHPFVKRKVALQRQNYRCAGCGLKVTTSLSKRFRYCEYLGKYFCTSCHQNKSAIIPAKILSKWDFKKYPVSDFSKELLKKMVRDPLFNVLDISPNLYRNVRFLAITKELRQKLHYVKNFLRTCRHAEVELSKLLQLPLHLFDDPDSYSIEDLVQVKTGHMHLVLKALVQECVGHVVKCQLCQVKGFVCEFCKVGDDVLFPFDLLRVVVCKECKTCYHRACFVQDKCPKCERVRARNLLLLQKLSDESDDLDAAIS